MKVEKLDINMYAPRPTARGWVTDEWNVVHRVTTTMVELVSVDLVFCLKGEYGEPLDESILDQVTLETRTDRLEVRVQMKVGDEFLEESVPVSCIRAELEESKVCPNDVPTPWLATTHAYELGEAVHRIYREKHKALRLDREAREVKYQQERAQRLAAVEGSGWEPWLARAEPLGDVFEAPDGWVLAEDPRKKRGLDRYTDLHQWVDYGDINDPPWRR